MAANLSQSYEKIFLVIAIIAALGLGTMVFLQAGKLEDKYARQALPKQDAPALPGEEQINSAVSSLGKSKDWEPAKLDGKRRIDLMTGIPWVLTKEGTPIDLLAEDEAEVHEGIPNIKWVEYGLDAGYADSPERDPDKDGFSNREEFDAGTSPVNFKDHPPLGPKLRLANLEVLSFLLQFSSEIGDNQFQFKYSDANLATKRKQENRMRTFIGRGDSFFPTAPALQRFRLKDVVEEQVTSERTNITSAMKFAFVEDLKPNKAGTTYKIPRRMRDTKQYIQRDYTAVLELAAIGQGGVQFRVEENSRFSLPYDPNAAEKPYLFKEVRNGDTVVIEWDEEGQTKTLELRKPAG